VQAKFYWSWAGGPVLIVRTAVVQIDFLFQDCNDCKCLSPGTTNAVKLSRFFDKVCS
jgi:hypothetical protein